MLVRRLSFASPWLVVGGLVGVLGLPLVVALVVLHDPRWYPLGDLAMIELRVRDVGPSDPPTLGLPGRITGHDLPGSHPGPLAFYALAPVYRLTGASAWGLKVSVAVLGLVAVALVLWMVRRRAAGRVLPVLGMAAALALLLRAYGPHLLTEPWNPFMPVLWWTVFLVAVWSVLDDDLVLLPVAVFAGCFCVQTHISYLGLVPVLVLVGAWVLGRRLWERWRNPVDRRRLLLWMGGAAALGVVLWLPPVVEELAHDPGNMSIVLDNFRHPADDEIGLGRALDLWFARLDPRGFVTGNLPGAGVPTTLLAVATVALWATTAAATVRRRRRSGSFDDDDDDRTTRTVASLVHLHLVVGVALAAGLVSLTRIFGIPWFYLHLWGWGTTALLLLATGWSAAVVLAPSLRSVGWSWRWSAKTSQQNGKGAVARRAGAALLAAIVVVSTGAFAYDAAHTEVPSARMTAALGAVAPDAVDALTAEDAPGGGRDGRYLVRWNDPVAMGDQGWGLLDELERAGLDVNVEPAPPDARAGDPRLITDRGARGHRLLQPDEATGIVTLAIGPAIDALRQEASTVELAYHEPRSPDERARYEELRGLVEEELVATGLASEVNLDGSLFALSHHPGLSIRAKDALAEMQTIGLPLAVFVQPT